MGLSGKHFSPLCSLCKKLAEILFFAQSFRVLRRLEEPSVSSPVRKGGVYG
jgi:hypothetical protein